MTTIIFEKNNDTIDPAKKLQFHSHTKDIAIQYHFLHEKQAKKKGNLQSYQTKYGRHYTKALLPKDMIISF